MTSATVERSRVFTPGRGLLVFWTIEAVFAMALAGRLLTVFDYMSGRRLAADGIPPGQWFLVQPPFVHALDGVVVESSAPFVRWLQQSSDAAYCCWRKWSPRHAYPGFGTEDDCRRALDGYRQRAAAPHALWELSRSAGMALANARCVHATTLWAPVAAADDE